jgi:hypothetical protein
LIVARWPATSSVAQPVADCAHRLTAGGSAAVVLPAGDLAVNQVVLGAARRTGLRYRQHLVAVHVSASPGDQTATTMQTHSDVLIFQDTGRAAGQAEWPVGEFGAPFGGGSSV